jgi:hypothetical protein
MQAITLLNKTRPNPFFMHKLLQWLTCTTMHPFASLQEHHSRIPLRPSRATTGLPLLPLSTTTRQRKYQLKWSLRVLVLAAVAGRHSVLKSALQNESIVELLRSNAYLATDLLLGGLRGPKVENVSEHGFMCNKSPLCSRWISQMLVHRVLVWGGVVHGVRMDPEQCPNDTRTGLICSRLSLVFLTMESTLHLLWSLSLSLGPGRRMYTIEVGK